MFLFMLGFVVARRASSPGVIGRVYANDANVGPWCGPAVVGRGFHGGARGLQRPPRVLRVPPSLKRNPSGRHPGKDTQMGDDASDDGSGDVPFHLNDMDKWVLSQTDDTFKCHTWDDLRQIIRKLRAQFLHSQFCPSYASYTHTNTCFQRPTSSPSSRGSRPIFGGTSSGAPTPRPSTVAPPTTCSPAVFLVPGASRLSRRPLPRPSPTSRTIASSSTTGPMDSPLASPTWSCGHVP